MFFLDLCDPSGDPWQACEYLWTTNRSIYALSADGYVTGKDNPGSPTSQGAINVAVTSETGPLLSETRLRCVPAFTSLVRSVQTLKLKQTEGRTKKPNIPENQVTGEEPVQKVTVRPFVCMLYEKQNKTKHQLTEVNSFFFLLFLITQVPDSLLTACL